MSFKHIAKISVPMRIPKLLAFIWLTISLLLSACKENMNEATWDIDIVAPVIKTTLTLNNLTKDSIIQTGSDNSLRVVYEKNLEEIFLDTLLTIPDTTITNNLFSVLPLNVGSGQFIPELSQETKYYLKGAELTKAVASSGKVTVKMTSQLSSKLFFTYKIPSAKLNGAIFQFSGEIEPNGSVYEEFDVSGYTFDLRGLNGNKVNTMVTSFSGQVDPAGSGISLAANQTFITVENGFVDIIPEYVRGYFGNQVVKIGPDTATIKFMQRIIDGGIGLDSATLSLNFSNGIGADAKAKVNYLTAVNHRTGNTVNLTHPIIGTNVNISRAYETFIQSGEVIPSEKEYIFNNANSNLKQIFENLPEELLYSVDFELNPLGNISTGNDFYYNRHQFQAKLKLDIPLSLYSDNLTLIDTIDFNASGSTLARRIQNGNFRIVADNSFPMEAKLQLFLMDSNGVMLDSLITQSTIATPDLDINKKVIAPKNSTVIATITEAQSDAINETKKIKIKASFTTPLGNELVKIYSDNKLDIKLIADFNYLLEQP